MKWLERLLLLVIAAGIMMAPQTAQVNSYVNGQVLTANQLNSEFGNIYSTINGLDEDNLLSTTAIPPALINPSIDGSGIVRDVNGVLSVNPDGSTVEINSDMVRVKDAGITLGKLAADSVNSSKIVDASVTGTDIASGTVTGTNIASATITPSNLISNFDFKAGDGSAASPSYSFSSDTNTGFYRSASDRVAFSAGGTVEVVFDSSAIATTDGTASVPSHGFISDSDTGIYRPSANTVGITAGGSQAAAFSSAGISLDATTFFKAKAFSGTLAANGTITLTVPGVVLGSSGHSEFNGGPTWNAMGGGNSANTSATSASIGFSSGLCGGDTSKVCITNYDTNTTNEYAVIVFYQ